MVSSNAINLNPTVIPEYATSDNMVSSNTITLKNAVSPDRVTQIIRVNNNAITKGTYTNTTIIRKVLALMKAMKHYGQGEMKVHHKSPLTMI